MALQAERGEGGGVLRGVRRRAAERSSSPCSEPWRHDPAFPGRLSGRRSLASLPVAGEPRLSFGKRG